MQLKSIILDDEILGRENLASLLKEYCGEYVNVVADFDSAQKAREYLEENKVDLIFSDIEMPRENGIEFLESISDQKIPLIFVTGYNQYAIRAIQASAFDYLLKPVDIQELKRAVVKTHEAVTKNRESFSTDYTASMGSVIENLYRSGTIKKICIPHVKGLKVINLDDIIYLEGDNNYTHVFLKDQPKLLVSKTLKDFENIMDEGLFFRVHKSSIINLSHLKEFLIEDGGYAVLSDGKKIPVSRRKIPEFVEKIKSVTKFLGTN